MKKLLLWLPIFLLAFALFLYPIIRGVYQSARSEKPDSPASQAREPASPASSTLSEKDKESVTSHGIASFYGVNSNGTRTASGVPLSDSVSTAAHRTLPFGTLVRVTNLDNGKSEVVKVTDRGPFKKGRIIDVSQNAAEKLGMIQAGVVSVELEVLTEGPEPLRTSLAKDSTPLD